MSLIKQAELVDMAAVRHPLQRAAPAPPARPPEPLIPAEVRALRQEVEALAARLADRDAEVERLQGDVRRAYRDGEAEGRKQGREEADQRRAEALVALGRGVEAALERFAGELEALERLSVLVARQALSKVLGDDADRTATLAAAIRHQLQDIEADSVVAVRVSTADFGDPRELERLAAELASTRVDLAADDDVGRGDCRIQLRLGTLDVGLPRQWARLERTLTALAEAEAAA
jgi:type III secretion protein L